MIKLFLALFLSFPVYIFAVEPTLKKGMILVCPISQKPVYRIMESISDGESVAAKHLFDIEANKPATPGQGAKCNSLLVGFAGTCAYTKASGWLPEWCKESLVMTYHFQGVL